MSEEALENLIQLIEVLQKAEEDQKHMTEEEKKNNAVKMHTEKGDIWY